MRPEAITNQEQDMVLKAIHDKIEEVPEEYRDLYTEKAGKWELTGVSGIKTQADVDRVQESLRKERDEHKATKDSLGGWAELGELGEIQKKLDRIPELEAAAEGKLDDSKIEELANRRAEGMIASKLAPVERENRRLAKEREDAKEAAAKALGRLDELELGAMLNPLMAEMKILPEHYPDVELYANRHLERTEDGTGWQAREGSNGVTAGSSPKDWLTELSEKRPGWLPPTQGGGAPGSGGAGGLRGGKNPWARETWNMTEQGRIATGKGEDTARRMAEAAGTKLGGGKPAPKT